MASRRAGGGGLSVVRWGEIRPVVVSAVVDESKYILLVEDDPDHEALTLRAFAKNNFGNQVVVVRDGAEALDWLHKRGAHQDRSEPDPTIVLLTWSCRAYMASRCCVRSELTREPRSCSS